MADTNWRRRPGRPSLPEGQGKRFAMNLRTTREIREKLEAAALASGRSLCAEAEYRVQQSFDIDSISQWLDEHYQPRKRKKER